MIVLFRRVRFFKRFARLLVMRGGCCAWPGSCPVVCDAESCVIEDGWRGVFRRCCLHTARLFGIRGSVCVLGGAAVEDFGDNFFQPVEHIAR